MVSEFRLALVYFIDNSSQFSALRCFLVFQIHFKCSRNQFGCFFQGKILSIRVLTLIILSFPLMLRPYKVHFLPFYLLLQQLVMTFFFCLSFPFLVISPLLFQLSLLLLHSLTPDLF